MTAQWPLVLNQLLAVLPTLEGWENEVTVFDGPLVSSSAEMDYITVGYVEGDDQAGTYSLTQANSGLQWEETGTIRAQLTCRSGDTDIGPRRARAFTLADALEAFVRSDRRLGGVLSPEGTSDISSEVMPAQTGNGASFSLVFTLTYFTVT